jgi:hypothetical protein
MFKKVNDRNAKRIVLYLFKHKGRELTRKNLLDDLKLDMTDEKLEEKMEALVKADIIEQGQSNYDYRCVRDNIFDKVFRGVYQKEIEHFDVRNIKKEYEESLEKLREQYRKLQGKYSYMRGYNAEYLILDRLKLHARENNELLKSITRYLPGDFNFCNYTRVWRYDSSPEYAKRKESHAVKMIGGWNPACKTVPCLMRTEFHSFSLSWQPASGAGKQNQVNVAGFLVDPE